MNVTYSIVIPLKNEEGNIRELIEEIEPVMKSLGKPWELVCVDDGSTDNTLSILEELAKANKHIRTLMFTKNFGQSSAFDAGFKASRGEYIITMDGDRQNDPKDIPKLVEASKHYDMVCGIRQKRRDTWIKKATSFLANKVRSRVCGDGIADTGCSLKIYRKNCLSSIKMYHGMHRFLPALFQIEGYTVGQIPVHHRERAQGMTKYSFMNRSFNTVADMFAVRWMKKRQLRYRIEREIG